MPSRSTDLPGIVAYMPLLLSLLFPPSILFFSDLRFAEFPQPGDVKKQMLPIFIDPEETKSTTFSLQNESNSKRHDNLDYWMPVRVFIILPYPLLGQALQNLLCL